jgi:spore maturation protein CgeB
LFLDAGYFLSREIILAAKALGSEVETWGVPSPSEAGEADYPRLLSAIKAFRPELILTVNHLGFDTEGILASILDRLGIPAASWFVDSPAVILGGARLGPRSGVFVFSWDSDYLQALSDFGFESPAYLPLASSEAFFRAPPMPGKSIRSVAFVGDSLDSATTKYLALSGLGGEILPTLDELADSFLKSGRRAPELEAFEISSRLSLEAAERRALEALITWRASRLARLKVLRLIPGKKLAIAGDKGWKGLVPGAKILGRVDYYNQLCPFYQGTAVNLNISSAQMRSGLNQRVFDVPASKAFLLTDGRSQLEPLYEPGKEVAVYSHPLEAKEKALWYLDHPRERAAVAERAWRRTRGEHLYRHRLRKLLGVVGLGRGEHRWPQ